MIESERSSIKDEMTIKQKHVNIGYHRDNDSD